MKRIDNRYLIIIIIILISNVTYAWTLDNNVLTIGTGETYIVAKDETLNVDKIVFVVPSNGQQLGTLQNYGIINCISQSDMTIKGHIINHSSGIITFGAKNINLICNQDNGYDYKFENDGEVKFIADENNPIYKLYIESNNSANIVLKDGISFTAKNFDVEFNVNYNELNLGNMYVSDGNMTITMTSSGSTNADIIVVDGILSLQNGVQNFNIKETAFLEIVNNSTWNLNGIKAKDGANIFIKSISDGCQPTFIMESGSTFTICKNPHKNVSDWSSSNPMVTLNSGTAFNYISSEYEGTNPIEEGDAKLNNVSASYISYTNDPFLNVLIAIWNFFHRTKPTDARINAMYSTPTECIDDFDNHKSELLPITLVSFSFNQENDQFIWQTASESNNDYFVVEYSKNGTDWVECTEHVSSLSETGYTYSAEPIISIRGSVFSYFRLKQVDLDGKYSYSDVVTVSFTVDNPCSEEYEDCKIQVRELGDRWYRVVNGELIYCEGDNQ